MGVKVLLADDEPVGRLLLKRWLEEWGYEVVTVGDGVAALQVLQTDPEVRMVVVDWVMPTIDGIDVCRWIRARDKEPYVYTILVTARDDKADIVAGLEAGADDYIIKPCNRLELKVRLRSGQRVIELQEQLVRAREKLRFEAMHDSLTSLPNRAAILERLDGELARSARTGKPVSVVMVDLDHFKRVNDDFGHAAGDAVLRGVSNVFNAGVRPYDSVGRVGGEEFLVVLPECDLTSGLGVSERLGALLRSHPIQGPMGQLKVTASMGVASTSQVEVLAAEELTRAADAALYRAKRAGRDRTEGATASDWALEPPPALGSISA